MRTLTILAAVLAALVSAGAAPTGAGQGAPPVPAGVPVEREPRHHVVFENEAVRVIDARLPAADVTLYHTHTADNVPVVIHGGRMTVQPLGGAPQTASPRTGDASFVRGGYTHQIANVGADALQFLDVEIHSPVPSQAVIPMPEHHELVLENGRVRLLRYIAGGALHAHDRGLLAIVVPNHHEWTAGVPEGAPAPGAYWWLPPRDPGRSVPAGTEMIEIEVK